MKKVKFFTNLEHEFIQNFKYAQVAFTKLKVEKVGKSLNINIFLVFFSSSDDSG